MCPVRRRTSHQLRLHVTLAAAENGDAVPVPDPTTCHVVTAVSEGNVAREGRTNYTGSVSNQRDDGSQEKIYLGFRVRLVGERSHQDGIS